MPSSLSASPLDILCIRRNTQAPAPTAAKTTKPPMTPPTIAITLEDDPFAWSFPVGVLAGLAEIDGGEPELVELSCSETVVETAVSLSG